MWLIKYKTNLPKLNDLLARLCIYVRQPKTLSHFRLFQHKNNPRLEQADDKTQYPAQYFYMLQFPG